MATLAYLRVSTHEPSVKNQFQEIKQAGYHVDYAFAD
jgi:DNA invertase Pin-like site-specific DNA recombinase